MIRNRRNSLHKANSILGHLAGDRKKTIVAVSLVVIMGLMWVRVLTGKKPVSAGAASNAPAQQQNPQRPLNVRFLALPEVPGRNDSIHRDFFAARDWEPFRQGQPGHDPSTNTEVHVVSSDQVQEVVMRVGKKLTLQAILWSESPKAFLNDELVAVGDKLSVRDGQDVCEFEVLHIYAESVLVGCNGTRLALKLTRPFDVSK